MENDAARRFINSHTCVHLILGNLYEPSATDVPRREVCFEHPDFTSLTQWTRAFTRWQRLVCDFADDRVEPRNPGLCRIYKCKLDERPIESDDIPRDGDNAPVQQCYPGLWTLTRYAIVCVYHACIGYRCYANRVITVLTMYRKHPQPLPFSLLASDDSSDSSAESEELVVENRHQSNEGEDYATIVARVLREARSAAESDAPAS